MPVRRNADGDVVDEITRRKQESGQPDPAGGGEPAARRPAHGVAPTVRIDRGSGARGGAGDARRYGDPTRRGSGRDPGTRIHRPGQPREPAGAAAPAGRPGPGGAPDAMADPPAGWLVVVAGPGRGNVVTLGNGVNTIGRDRTARVSLDYGDDTISRTGHGSITYDPRHRKFWVHQSGGTNLTYVEDEPVLAPRELAPLAHVQMGNTVLRFVPLCGPEFSWEDEDEPDDR